MYIILCIDDRAGLEFFGKRQSADTCVAEDILRLTEGHTLWVRPCTAELFPAGTVQVSGEPLKKADPGDYCFLEAAPFPRLPAGAEGLVLYRWNRHYPSTSRLPISVLENASLTETREFPGHSHDMITVERYSYE